MKRQTVAEHYVYETAYQYNMTELNRVNGSTWDHVLDTAGQMIQSWTDANSVQHK